MREIFFIFIAWSEQEFSVLSKQVNRYIHFMIDPILVRHFRISDMLQMEIK